MAIDWSDIAAILDAIAWPVTVIVAALMVRRPLADGLPRLLSRTTKITLGDIGIELAPARELTPSWSAANIDVRSLTSADVFDSATMSLFQQLSAPTKSEYATIDLGSGDKWLTSRLYIFAVVLGKVSHLQAFTFLETRDGVPRSFVGVADPASVERALARRYPWLEVALLAARLTPFPADPKTTSEVIDLGSLGAAEPWKITAIVRSFVDALQQSVPPPDQEAHEWEEFSHNQPLWERTRWIDGAAIEEILADCIDRSALAVTPDTSRKARTAGILRRRGKYIALVDAKERFVELVDRTEIVERLVEQVLERQDDAAN